MLSFSEAGFGFSLLLIRHKINIICSLRKKIPIFATSGITFRYPTYERQKAISLTKLIH